MSKFTKKEIEVRDGTFLCDKVGTTQKDVIQGVLDIYEAGWTPVSIDIKLDNDEKGYTIGGYVEQTIPTKRLETDKEFDERVAKTLLEQYKTK